MSGKRVRDGGLEGNFCSKGRQVEGKSMSRRAMYEEEEEEKAGKGRPEGGREKGGSAGV